ncbi:MAG: response regulator [Thermodesulfobacteriota bacterium]
MKSSLRVLLVEDNAGDVDLVNEFLSQARQVVFKVECVPRLEQAISILKRDRIDVVLLDLGLPDSSGLETLSRVLKAGGRSATVVLTGLNDEHMGLEAVRMGAQDYLPKEDIGPHVLIRTVLYSVERKKLHDQLGESEGRYRTLFEQSKDAVFITSREGKLLDANQAFLTLFHLTREEARNLDVLCLYNDPADRMRFQEEMERTGALAEYETTFRRTTGEELNCLLASTFRRDIDGTILGYQGIIRDVTEQKRLQKQLAQSQKMEAIGTLAGGIAHDFNNLLTVISGYAEILLQSKDKSDPDYGDLQKILHASKRGAELVRNLLIFSRKSDAKPRPINLNHEVEQVKSLLDRTIPKMIEIRLHRAGALRAVNADSGQIEQVLMNLAVNAKDAMPDGGTLTIETANTILDEAYARSLFHVEPGEYVILRISDTGHGMDKKTLDHIFEPFFTTKEAGKGTGLGLATVYGIIKQHRGHISCYSEVGKGTTFNIYLPAIPDETETHVESPGELPAMGTETVLLVDDEDLIRELGAQILTKHGYTVLQAVNGRVGLDLFKQERSRISLVILDLIMPEMGGGECLNELIKIDPNVKVLIASGYAADASVEETAQIGAKGYVTKPFSVNELLRDVRRVLDQE